MDDFTPYGSNFQEALNNLRKVLTNCIEMNLSLSPEKCEYLMTEGTVLGHTISQQGLKVDLNKIAIIQRVPPPQKQFDLTIVDKLGKENVVVDFLSRLELPAGEEGMVDDEMPDEHLFSILVLSPWMGKPTQRDEMPLQPQVTFEPFKKWGMDFVGLINPPSKQKPYIIVYTDYLTKWVKTKEIKEETEEKVVDFLRENIFYKFGYPRELVIDQGSQFTSNLVEDLLTHHKIKHRTSTTYHPQANGQVEVTNRALEGILTKVVSSNIKYWANPLVEATWAYNTTWKTTTGLTPYEVVYGKKALLSIEFEYNTLRMVAQLFLDLGHTQNETLL
eukprot:PITA_09628